MMLTVQPGKRHARQRFGVVLLLAMTLGACSRVPPLAVTEDTPEGVARAVLEAVASADRSQLDRLALNEMEFRDHVWPSLPAAREERNLPFSYVWGDLHQKSNASLGRILAHHGRRRYELVKVAFERTTDYGSYRVHRDSSFVIRTPSGATETVRLCGSMIEQDGAWKVFSYVVDD